MKRWSNNGQMRMWRMFMCRCALLCNAVFRM